MSWFWQKKKDLFEDDDLCVQVLSGVITFAHRRSLWARWNVALAVTNPSLEAELIRRCDDGKWYRMIFEKQQNGDMLLKDLIWAGAK